ncbi:hypothetical protein ABT124_37465 [Streptomyces sp. NPDC001982]|uniref:hypothetical protein n=1 Tax=unclassified Streptomyces TaxID=2593676 RepID=UPI003322038C
MSRHAATLESTSTAQIVRSATKGVAAAVLLLLHQRGELTLTTAQRPTTAQRRPKPPDTAPHRQENCW